MKNLLMISHSSNAAGGGEDDFMNLLKHLHTNYYIVSVVPEGVRVKQYSEYSHELKVIPDGIFPFTGFSIKSYIKYILLILKKIIVLLPFLLKVRNRIDVCYVNSSTCFVETLLVSMLGIPFVISIKEIIQPDVARELLYKYYGYTSKKVIVISKILKSLFEKVCDYKSTNIIYSSIDEKLMKIVSESEIPAGLAKTNDSFRILNVGVICQMKNQKLLIEAASNLNDKCKYEIIFVGRIIDHNYYDLIRAIKLKERENVEIVFMGEMSKESVLYLMKSSDCVVITSQREGMSLVLAETLYLNKPLITTEVGVVPEIIKHGINGLIIDKHDPKYLADYLMKLASDDSLRCDICGMNTETYKEYFDLRLYLNKHEAILLEAIRKKY